MLQPVETEPKVSKLTEALELLNEAAKDKKDEMKELVTDKYSHLREAVATKAEQGKEILKTARHLAQDIALEDREKIKEALILADKRVRKDPWLYLGTAAVVSLLLGYVMGSSKRK